MFKKTKEPKKEVMPVPQQAAPEQVEELEVVEEEVVETVVPEESVTAHPPVEEPVETPEEPVEEEITAEQVMQNFANITAVLSSQNERLARIEHHLRIDFN